MGQAEAVGAAGRAGARGWEPAQVSASGATLVRRAADVQRTGAALAAVGSGLSGVWSGTAADAAMAHHRRRAREVDDLATVVHTAGRALERAGDELARSYGEGMDVDQDWPAARPAGSCGASACSVGGSSSPAERRTR